MILFEVFLTPDYLGDPLLSEETIAETGAQVMTPEEAAFVGLEGIPDDPQKRKRLLIACKPGDMRLVQSRLEAHAQVASFRHFEVG